MQKNFYLDELGIPAKMQYANMCANDDPRQGEWAKQREKFGFDERETWNLDHCFVEWLYCHLRMYKDAAEGNIDWSNRKVDVNLATGEFAVDKEADPITLEQAIDYILERLGKALQNWDYVDQDEKLMNGVKEAIIMWAEIYPACWW